MQNSVNQYDKIIIGAGMFGLYAALKSSEKGESVLVLECECEAFKRASYINQARVHNGYHYPRSYSTAIKSAHYFQRFVRDYEFSILKTFKKIYATSDKFSYTSASQFEKFCNNAKIPCEYIKPSKYFNNSLCDGAFETLEYTFDAKLIMEYLLNKLYQYKNCTIKYKTEISEIEHDSNEYLLQTNTGRYSTKYLINATYASLNQILKKANLDLFNMKYELCEIILCNVTDNIKDIGITVMDGPFFSLMPFGKTGYHSLTAVGSTPHLVSKNSLPEFKCQSIENKCSKNILADCNICVSKPKTAFKDMYMLAKKYLKDNIDISYSDSLFAMKAILSASEVDDSRPTIIKFQNLEPKFLSVFSGKINTIYDLDEVL